MIFHIRQKLLSSQSGLSIVATVMIMLILALFAAAAVSLITTSTGSGIQEERGVGAFYIADGGMYYTLKLNTYPYYDLKYDGSALSNMDLGDGSFSVTVPRVNSLLDVGTTDTSITVSSTDGFTTATDGRYWTLLCSTASGTISMASNCEKMSFTSKDSTSFTGDVLATTRGRDSTAAATHPTGTVVMMYSWDINKTTTITTRTFGKTENCSSASSTICVSSTTPFAESGFVRIDDGTEDNREDVFYDGKGSTGQCGTGCSACLGTNVCKRKVFDCDSSPSPSCNKKGTVDHISGTLIWQSEFNVIVTSEGKTPGLILGPLTNIKRVLQTNVLPLYP